MYSYQWSSLVPHENNNKFERDAWFPWTRPIGQIAIYDDFTLNEIEKQYIFELLSKTMQVCEVCKFEINPKNDTKYNSMSRNIYHTVNIRLVEQFYYHRYSKTFDLKTITSSAVMALSINLNNDKHFLRCS